ncbi:MAG: hypothetical protein H0X14_02660 [Acidobacteria bacterium]|nr:hypothetical protein [Acidobacteriota bacterium]
MALDSLSPKPGSPGYLGHGRFIGWRRRARRAVAFFTFYTAFRASR